MFLSIMKKHVSHMTYSLPTDLFKAFDCIKQDLSIAKLAAYGFDSRALSFVFSYLNKRKQRTKIHKKYIPTTPSLI